MSTNAWRGLSRKHPLARAKAEYEACIPPLPPPVLNQMRDLFKHIKSPGSLTLEQAQHEAQRLECHVQLLRIRHAMAQMAEIDRGYFTLSKAASCWMRILDKLNSTKHKGSNGHQGRQPVVIATPSRGDEAENEDGVDDGETA